MESLILNLQSENQITEYLAEGRYVRYETEIATEILSAIENGNLEKLDWFNSFGESLRVIIANVKDYRKGLEFGFTEIAFGQYGWFKRPEFLDEEELTFGDTRRYGNYSTITLARGLNHVWTYGLSCNYGIGGCSWGLSVYGKQFQSRQSALDFALNELKDMMKEKIGNSDTTNYKQPIIVATLKDIEKAQNGLVQLSLF